MPNNPRDELLIIDDRGEKMYNNKCKAKRMKNDKHKQSPVKKQKDVHMCTCPECGDDIDSKKLDKHMDNEKILH